MANILYIAQCFSLDSEPGGQGQRHFKHAQALAEEGHCVTVITRDGNPMCPNARTKGSSDPYLQAGLRVIRLAVPRPDRPEAHHPAPGSFAFSVAALLVGLKLMVAEKRRFGFVLVSSPPWLVALAAYVLSVFNRADFYVETHDWYSQVWSEGTPVNRWNINQFLMNFHRALESWLYRKARRIIVLSPAFATTLKNQMPSVHHKIETIPNGADLEFYQYPQLCRESYLRATPKTQALFHVNYAGAFSDEAKLEVLLAVAAIMQERNPDVRFNLVGGGVQFNNIRRMAEEYELWNMTFWDALPQNKISKFLMEGDLSMIHYRALPILGKMLPHPLFDYLAAGRPILAAVPEGEVSRILKQSKAGMTVPPENVMALVEAIQWFYEHPQQGLKMGVQGYHFVTRHFDRRRLVNRLLGLFPRIIPMQSAHTHDSLSPSDVRTANRS